jgi:hypothetical protein
MTDNPATPFDVDKADAIGAQLRQLAAIERALQRSKLRFRAKGWMPIGICWETRCPARRGATGAFS